MRPLREPRATAKFFWTAVVEQERCIGCGLCTTVCPTEAISLKVRTPEQLDKFYGSVEEYTEDLTR